MDVLVACEYSGIVRDAFRRWGHDAVSCDLLPTERAGPHYEGPVEDLLEWSWDLIIAHPPCTRLSKSGVRWLHERNLWSELDEACAFFRLFLEHPCPRVAVENPIPHGHAVQRIGRKYDQIIHPWQFGHPERKPTCLWLKGLPELRPTDDVRETMERLPWKEQNRVHFAGPGADRGKIRSRFFEGVANAMAEQWGGRNQCISSSV